MKLRLNNIRNLLLVTLIAVSLGVSAFAHRTLQVWPAAIGGTLQSVGGSYPTGLDLQAYRLPDGSLPSFCLNPENPDGNPNGKADTCDFCTLAHGMGIPTADSTFPNSPPSPCIPVSLVSTVSSSAVFRADAPITGPPLFS